MTPLGLSLSKPQGEKETPRGRERAGRFLGAFAATIVQRHGRGCGGSAAPGVPASWAGAPRRGDQISGRWRSSSSLFSASSTGMPIACDA